MPVRALLAVLPSLLCLTLLACPPADSPPAGPSGDDSASQPADDGTPKTTEGSELPEALSFLPDPIVVDAEELTEEMLEREAERTEPAGALVVRYPEAQYHELYGPMPPLDERSWWREAAGETTPDEFWASEALIGQPMLSAVEMDGLIHTAPLCLPSDPDNQACIRIPGTGECQCVTLRFVGPEPPDEELELDFTSLTLTRPVACETLWILTQEPPCRERTECETGCEEPVMIDPGFASAICLCPDVGQEILGF